MKILRTYIDKYYKEKSRILGNCYNVVIDNKTFHYEFIINKNQATIITDNNDYLNDVIEKFRLDNKFITKFNTKDNSNLGIFGLNNGLNSIEIDSEDFYNIDVRSIDADYLSKIKTEQIYEFLFYASDTRKNMWSAKARKLSAIKGLYKYLTIKKNYFEENPAINIESPKPKKALPKFLNLDESLLFLQAIDQCSGKRKN